MMNLYKSDVALVTIYHLKGDSTQSPGWSLDHPNLEKKNLPSDFLNIFMYATKHRKMKIFYIKTNGALTSMQRVSLNFFKQAFALRKIFPINIAILLVSALLIFLLEITLWVFLDLLRNFDSWELFSLRWCCLCYKTRKMKFIRSLNLR